MVHVRVAGAVGVRERGQRQLLLLRLVGLVVEQPGEVDVAEVLLEVVEPRQHVRPVRSEPRRLLDVAERQGQQVAAHQRGVAGVESLVVAAHRRRGRAEGLVVEVGQQRFDVGVRVPHQAVGDVVPAAVRAPVVAALGVHRGGAVVGVAADRLLHPRHVRPAPAGQAVEVPRPDREVFVQPEVPRPLGPQVQQFVERVPPGGEAGRELHVDVRLEVEAGRLAVVVVGVHAHHLAGEFLADRPGHLVGQPEGAVGDGAKLAAVVALAVPAAVAGFERDHVGVGVLLEVVAGVLQRHRPDGRVARTELRPPPLALHQGQVLRVLGELGLVAVDDRLPRVPGVDDQRRRHPVVSRHDL